MTRLTLEQKRNKVFYPARFSVILKSMLKRFAVNFVLIFLFAFVQIGAVTHEISHLNDFAKHQQQDKNTHNEQCPQCISFAKIGSGIASHAFILPLVCTSFSRAIGNYFHYPSYLHTAYAARAPPQTHRI
jgi:hypothetical protein